MSDKFTLGDLMDIKDAFDNANVPTKGRVVRLWATQFYDLLQAQGVTANSFKVRWLVDGIVEVYL